MLLTSQFPYDICQKEIRMETIRLSYCCYV